MEPQPPEGKLALVDDEPGVGAPRGDLVEDPVERHDLEVHLALEEQPQGEIRGGERAGDRDRP
ncbi:hypothetical protein D3C83_189640 [compost metagenome]